MSQYNDKGVVLRGWRLGESDRIVVLLTAEHGKVRAVAKGVRKTKSKFGGRLELTSHVSFQMFEGRGELGIVTQAETIERFVNLRNDPNLFASASAMLEVSDHFSLDQNKDVKRYEMLVGALRTLDENPAPLVLPAFLLKVLAHVGLEPHLDLCTRCQSSGPLVSIDYNEGGVLCEKCRRGRSVTERSIAVMRSILGGGLSMALAVEDNQVCSEVESVAYEAVEFHLERRLRSRKVLDQT